MNGRLHMLAAALATLVVSTVVVTAAVPREARAGIVGRVYTMTENGPQWVHDATVTLYGEDGAMLDRVVTDRNGGFRFENLNDGRYSLFAEKPGVGQGRTEVVLRGAFRSRVTIYIQ